MSLPFLGEGFFLCLIWLGCKVVIS